MTSLLEVKPADRGKFEIIAIDDNELFLDAMREFGRHMLGRSIATASTAYHARELLHRLTRPAIFLVDHHMPRVKGLDLISQLIEAAQFPLECVLVTAETKESNPRLFNLAEETGIYSFSKGTGAALYTPGEDYARMIRFAEARLRLTLKQVVRQMTDSITGLYTWEGGEFMWPETWARAKRDGFALALAFLDLNDFKIVNDTFGHGAGDKLLRVVGKVVSEHVRDKARRRGDEFLIPMEIKDTHNSDRRAEEERIRKVAMEVVERVNASLQREKVEVAPGVYITPSISIGVAVLLRENMTKDLRHDFDVLLMKPAEVCMYQDKIRHYSLVVSAQDEALKKAALKKYRYYRKVAADKERALSAVKDSVNPL